MIRVMLDSDVLADLDGHAELLATYSDLIHNAADLEALKARHPDSEIVLIDRGTGDPTGEATVIDIETGAFGVDHVPGWVREKKIAGKKYLTGYCDRDNLPGVQAIEGQGIWHWVATDDGTCHIQGFRPLHGPAVVQILGEGALGVHADLSLVFEDGWHPSTAAAAAASGPAGLHEFSQDVGELQAKCPSWEIRENQNGSFGALLDGTRIELTEGSVAELEYRIGQLYPATITP